MAGKGTGRSHQGAAVTFLALALVLVCSVGASAAPKRDGDPERDDSGEETHKEIGGKRTSRESITSTTEQTEKQWPLSPEHPAQPARPPLPAQPPLPARPSGQQPAQPAEPGMQQ